MAFDGVFQLSHSLSLHSHHQSSAALHSFQLLKIQMKMSIVTVSSIDGNIRAMNSISMNHFFYYAFLKAIKKNYFIPEKFFYAIRYTQKHSIFMWPYFTNNRRHFVVKCVSHTLCVRSVSFKRNVHLNFGVVKAI